MPRYVDHDDRRRHIAATAAELVGTRGLEALTFRNVAEAAGSSTTVLTHYFADKRDLLRSTYEAVAARFGTRWDEAARSEGGLTECLEAWLPLDAERLTEWRLLTSFWGMAVSDPALASAQARHGRSSQRRIESLLQQYMPHIRGAEVELAGRRLIGFVLGLGAVSALDSDHWPPAQQRRALAAELASLRGGGGPGDGRPGGGRPGRGNPAGGRGYRAGAGGETLGGAGGAAASAGRPPAPDGWPGRPPATPDGDRGGPQRPARPPGDAAARRLRRDILAAVKQGPSPAIRRRRRRFPA